MSHKSLNRISALLAESREQRSQLFIPIKELQKGAEILHPWKG